MDTPLAPYFSDNLTSEDLDEMNIEVRLLCRSGIAQQGRYRRLTAGKPAGGGCLPAARSAVD